MLWLFVAFFVAVVVVEAFVGFARFQGVVVSGARVFAQVVAASLVVAVLLAAVGP